MNQFRNSMVVGMNFCSRASLRPDRADLHLMLRGEQPLIDFRVRPGSDPIDGRKSNPQTKASRTKTSDSKVASVDAASWLDERYVTSSRPSNDEHAAAVRHTTDTVTILRTDREYRTP